MFIFCCFSKEVHGTSLVVQWLRLCASSPGVQVQCLVWELRSCKMHGGKKEKKKEFLELNKNENATHQL